VPDILRLLVACSFSRPPLDFRFLAMMSSTVCAGASPDPKDVAADGPERDRFRGMIASINHAMVMRDTGVVMKWLDGHPVVQKGGLGALGYCMGGGYALSAAGTFPDRVVVAASFHGGSLATDKPDSPHRLAGRMRARVYVGAAEFDASFPPDQQNRLAHALTEAGVAHTIEIYANAKHGFAVNGHLAYDCESSERHWQRLRGLLEETLSPPRPGEGVLR